MAARRLILAGFVTRLALVLFSSFQDAHFKVKYTDIDYEVYTDAALHVLRGGSAFDRETYRYTPLVARLLVPNHVVSAAFGKVVFVTADAIISIVHFKLLTGAGGGRGPTQEMTPDDAKVYLSKLEERFREEPDAYNKFMGIMRTYKSRQPGIDWVVERVKALLGGDEDLLVGASPCFDPFLPQGHKIGQSETWGRTRAILWSLSLWLFNPYTATISSRGSSDSLSSLCILLMLLHLERRRYATAGFWFGLAVHIRLFPIIYVLPLLVHLGSPNPQLSSIFRPNKGLASLLSLNGRKVVFCCTSAVTCLALCAIFYRMEGQQYLDEAILYHFGRYDLAHNFSPWFFIFRVITGDRTRKALGLVAFLPQVGCWVYYGLVKESSLSFSLFMVTMSFVALNKVVTAQYFAWYLVLLPLIFPSISSAKSAGISRALKVSVSFWVLSQLNWLFWAYLLEFERVEAALFLVFLSSVVFVLTNLKVMVDVNDSYARHSGVLRGDQVKSSLKPLKE